MLASTEAMMLILWQLLLLCVHLPGGGKEAAGSLAFSDVINA